jgi:hypothetical protein
MYRRNMLFTYIAFVYLIPIAFYNKRIPQTNFVEYDKQKPVRRGYC